MNNSSQNLPEAITLVNLPDDLLCHILSFLKTKQAVATSILSKRWEFLWTYVDTLELSNWDHPNRPTYLAFDKKIQYMQFVRRVLELHRAPRIKRMELICYGLFHTDRDCDESDYVAWIQTLLLSKIVQSLHLCFPPNTEHHKWRLCFFGSKTLVELRLAHADITNIMDSPTAPFFPNLKKLELYHPRLNTDSLNRFISACLILEDFDFRCFFRHYSPPEVCYISSATLKTLQLCCDVSKIVLNTPALELLKFFKTAETVNLQLLVQSSMPSLHKARISMYLFGLDSLRFFKFISNVSVLCLKVKGIIDHVKLDLPVHFHNLTKLKIKAPRIGLDLLRFFMEKSNNLQVITLKKTASEAIWDEPKHVPKCLLSSLRTICIKGYQYEEQVELMIKYFLGNAKVLEDIEIRISDSVLYDNYELGFNMLQKISKFPRASEICEMTGF